MIVCVFWEELEATIDLVYMRLRETVFISTCAYYNIRNGVLC